LNAGLRASNPFTNGSGVEWTRRIIVRWWRASVIDVYVHCWSVWDIARGGAVGFEAQSYILSLYLSGISPRGGETLTLVKTSILAVDS